MKKLVRLTEADVIAEFLKGEFYRSEYDHDRRQFEEVVHHPQLGDESENALRRALLYRCRATMWREIPVDTHWWEIELEPEDLQQVNVFPRAQWRTAARGNFRALHVADLMRRRYDPLKPNDLASKINALRMMMWLEGPRLTIILIAKDERGRSTVLEGNHRFVASLLLPREIMQRRLRVVCGFSPAMDKCCWYKTSVPNIFRYLRNRIKHLWTDEADTRRWRPHAEPEQPVEDYAQSARLPVAKLK